MDFQTAVEYVLIVLMAVALMLIWARNKFLRAVKLETKAICEALLTEFQKAGKQIVLAFAQQTDFDVEAPISTWTPNTENLKGMLCLWANVADVRPREIILPTVIVDRLAEEVYPRISTGEKYFIPGPTAFLSLAIALVALKRIRKLLGLPKTGSIDMSTQLLGSDRW